MNYELLTDDVLLRLIKKSDETAYEAIFERYWEKIFFSAYKKTRSKEVAEDLTQNLFAALWDKRNTYDIIHLYKYLSTGIRNLVINYINHQYVKHGYEWNVNNDDIARGNSDEQVMLKDLQSKLDEALALLPEKTRQIFYLSRFEHFTVKEIAARFDISEKAVEYHITQSNKVLRHHLKDYLLLEILLFCTFCS